MKSKLKQAFTMAEVLLVVGIIGVTAALAIPNIKNNGFNEEKYVMLLRTTIPMLKAAEMKARAEYGDKTFNLQHVAKYLNVAKVCSVATDCLNSKPVLKFNGSLFRYDSHVEKFIYGVILQNGVVVIENEAGFRYIIALEGPKKQLVYNLNYFEIERDGWGDLYGLFDNMNGGMDYINWPILFGNLDMNIGKCSGLSWDGKHTCD